MLLGLLSAASAVETESAAINAMDYGAEPFSADVRPRQTNTIE